MTFCPIGLELGLRVRFRARVPLTRLLFFDIGPKVVGQKKIGQKDLDEVSLDEKSWTKRPPTVIISSISLITPSLCNNVIASIAYNRDGEPLL